MWEPRQDRGHQRKYLAPRQRAADPVDEAHCGVDQLLQAEANHQRRRQDQPRIGHQRRIVERRFNALD